MNKFTCILNKQEKLSASTIIAQGSMLGFRCRSRVGTFTVANQLMFPRSHVISTDLTSGVPHPSIEILSEKTLEVKAFETLQKNLYKLQSDNVKLVNNNKILTKENEQLDNENKLLDKRIYSVCEFIKNKNNF